MRSYRYIVNKEKRTVVCIVYVNKQTCKGTFTGIAKCSDEDEFNEEYGKLLAKRRAILKEQTKELSNIEWDLGFEDLEELKKFQNMINRRQQLSENIKKLKREISQTK